MYVIGSKDFEHELQQTDILIETMKATTAQADAAFEEEVQEKN